MIVILHKVHMIQSTVTHSVVRSTVCTHTEYQMFTQRDPSRIEIGHDWLNCVPSTPPIRVDNSKRSKGKEESFLIQTYILARNKGSYPHRKSITVSRKCIPHQHCFQLKLYLHIRVAKHGGEARYILQVQSSELAVNQGFPFWFFLFLTALWTKWKGKLGREDFSHGTVPLWPDLWSLALLCVSRLSQSCICFQLRHWTNAVA